MQKIFSWGLAIGVAIMLIALSVERMIAAGTGRAREVSVAALKEKLERRDGAHSEELPVVDSSVAPVDASNEVKSRSVAHHDLDALRTKWLAMGDEIALAWENCKEFHEAWMAALDRSIEEDTDDLESEESGERLKYYECLTPATVALLDLFEESVDPRELFTTRHIWDNRDYFGALQYVRWLLTTQLWTGLTMDDHARAAVMFSGLVKTPDFGDPDLLERVFDPFWCWSVLRGALESGAVDDGDWDELLAILEARRRQAFFFVQVQRETEVTLHNFEHWKSVNRDLLFSENPVSFLRTWAYPRLTPSLFNHDVDRFSRAMNELLDLAARPYYTIKDELAQFCEDFDVEDSFYQIKFTRGNPGWFRVVAVSRHGIEGNARAQASMDVIRIAILLDRQRRETGAYPDSLDALADKLGGEVPLNPLVGEPYLYERLGDTFRLGYRDENPPYFMEEEERDAIAEIYWHDPLGLEDNGE